MLTLAWATVVFITLFWMALYRRTAIFAGIFLLFSFATRTLSLTFIDLAGPLYSEQLDRMIGGEASIPLFACSILIPTLVLSYIFRPAAMQRLCFIVSPRLNQVSRDGVGVFILLASGAFITLLYGDMITRGPIPLFVDIDRIEYNAEMAGPLHYLLFKFHFLFAGLLGIMFVRQRIKGGDFDHAFFGLFLSLIIYFALTGNRFSIFYSFTSFFFIPIAALPAMSSCGLLPPPPINRPNWKKLLYSRPVIGVQLIIGFTVIAGLLINSVVNVRSYEDPHNLFYQRIFVQPVELWWATWYDLKAGVLTDSSLVWEALFGNPINPARNTSIQMLMVKFLGWERATQLVEMGQVYTGGYPEVLFELFGVWLSLPVALLFSILTALLLRLVVVSTSNGWILTALMALYVFFGFSLFFISGMLNFLTTWTFWVKLVLLAVVYWLESKNNSI